MARHYLIVGSGVAALAAAEAIREHDAFGEITVIGDDPDGYYSRPGLAYALNKSLPEQHIFPRSAQHLRGLFTKRIYARVISLHPTEHTVVLQDGRRLVYDRLLLATGSVAAPGDFPGHDLAGVVKLDTLEDVRCIVQMARRARRAVVVGGGIVAIELAEGLAAHDLEVHYFLRTDRFWSRVLDETESRMVERGLKAEGIRLHYRTLVQEAIGDKGQLTSVATTAGATLACQLLGVAIGLRARMNLAQAAGLATAKGILVNQYLETSAPDVYAAGDAAEMSLPDTEETWFETLWPKARNQGYCAGTNMAGVRTACTRNVLYNPVRIGGIITTTIGSVEQVAFPNLLAVIGSNGSGGHSQSLPEDRVRVLLGKHHIIGAVVMGDQTPARPLLAMIEAGVDIAPIRPAIEANPIRGIELISEYYRHWETAGVQTQH